MKRERRSELVGRPVWQGMPDEDGARQLKIPLGARGTLVYCSSFYHLRLGRWDTVCTSGLGQGKDAWTVEQVNLYLYLLFSLTRGVGPGDSGIWPGSR